jgi:hypothetical protein
MKKQVIFQPRKTKAAALKQLRTAIKDLGMENAIAIGIEVLQYPDGYRVVKNVNYTGSETVLPEQIFYTEDALERIFATDLATDFTVQRTEEIRKAQEALRQAAERVEA